MGICRLLCHCTAITCSSLKDTVRCCDIITYNYTHWSSQQPQQSLQLSDFPGLFGMFLETIIKMSSDFGALKLFAFPTATVSQEHLILRVPEHVPICLQLAACNIAACARFCSVFSLMVLWSFNACQPNFVADIWNQIYRIF